MTKDIDDFLLQSHILNKIEDNIIVTDFNGKILYWNTFAEKTFGYKKSDIVGKQVRMLYPDIDIKKFSKDFKKIKKNEEFVGEWKGKRKNGSDVWLKLKTTVLRDEKNRPIGFIGISKDITKEKLALEKNKDYEKRIQSFLKNSAEAIELFDNKGNLLYGSDSMQLMSGYKPKEVLGGNPFDHMHPEDVDRIKQKFFQLLNTPNEHITDQYRMKHKKGNWVWLEATATNLLQDPAINAIVVNVRNIDKQKRITEKLADQARLLDIAHDAFLVMDEQNCITYWNKGAEKLYGYTKEEALGKKAYKLLKTVFPRPFADLISQIKKKQVWRGELIHTTKKGKKITVESVWEVIYKDHEFSILEVNRDITLQKKALAEAIDTGNKLQVTFQHMSDAISVYNPSGELLFANDRYAHLLGFSSADKIVKAKYIQKIREEFIKKFIISDENGTIVDLLHSPHTPYAKSLEGEKNAKAIYHFFNKKTHEGHWLLTKAKKIIGTSGNVESVVQILTDITDLKNASDSIYFLSQVGQILSSSLDYEKTIESVVKLAVPKIADWCTVDMINQHGGVDLLAVAHKDPKKVKWAYNLRKKIPVDMDAKTGLPKVLRTGEPEFYPVITEDMIRAATTDENIRKLIKRIGFSSVIIVPIKVKGSVIGALQLVSAESKRLYNDLDFHMAEQLASRVSVAIENALLYEESQRERERLTNLVSTVPGVVWEAWGKPDESHRQIGFVSEHVETMLGYSMEEWLSDPNSWSKHIHPEDKQRVLSEAAADYMSGSGRLSRFRWVKKDGSVIWVESRRYIVKNEEGKPIGIRGVTMDITERMELEQRKDDFISMASHELKTPLTSAGVFTQILAKRFEKKGDMESSAILDKMNGSLGKLTELVKELLDVTKIQRGKLDFKKENFLVGDLVKNIVENLRHLTDHELQVDWQTRELVFADRDRIDQVLTNLITNAIKYSPERKKVIIASRKRGSEIVVSVQDFGIGIPKEQQEKIFDRFYQATGNGGNTYPGLGLGLYISSEIIKAHGGKMWVKSEKGKGSTFYFSLPIFIKVDPLELKIPS